MPFAKHLTGLSGWFRNMWRRAVVGKEVQSLTALEFIARFADTDAGPVLAATAQQLVPLVETQYLSEFLDDITEKFAEYGNST
jgi:phosphoribosylamine-glycine ligase